MKELKLPSTAHSIQKGVPLKLVLDKPAVFQLARNIKLVYEEFEEETFVNEAISALDELPLKERAKWIAQSLKNHLPDNYTEAISVLLNSLTAPLKTTTNLGLSGLFYFPHVCFIERYGLDKKFNAGRDPFDLSMHAQLELTQRFSSEFSIRRYIIEDPERTYSILYKWMEHSNPHVRRLCSEGTRPRLPWAKKISFLVDDPSPSLPILEYLKNDPDLYVRRSVANHIGDIAKDNLDFALNLCETWSVNATDELKWVIRHALRYPAKKGDSSAIKLRKSAK